MKQLNQKMILIVAIAVGVGSPIGLEYRCSATPATPPLAFVPLGPPTQSDTASSAWRLTTDGWQDSSKWPVANAYVPRRTIEALHPFVWSAMVLLGAIMTMIWASNEWEIARLFGTRS